MNCGEQQPEVDHLFKGEKSDSGYDDDGHFWRNTRSYISYQLQNKGLSGKSLEIHFSGNPKTDDVSILINDQPAKVIAVKDKMFVLKTDDKETVNVKIRTKTASQPLSFYQIENCKRLNSDS